MDGKGKEDIALALEGPPRAERKNIYGCKNEAWTFPGRPGNCELSAATMMTFPILSGQIHDSEELMQNGIFSTGDEFDIET